MAFEIEHFYRDGDGDDWRPAVLRAQHEWHTEPAAPDHWRGFTLHFGPRLYRFSGPIDLIRDMHIVGSGGYHWNAGTVLSFPSGSHGFICHTSTTAPAATPGSGGGSLVERVKIAGIRGLSTIGHGVVMYSGMALRDVCIQGFSGDGIHIEASSGATPPTNANHWRIEHCRVDGCAGNGLLVHGSDTNAGYATALDCSDNGGWGFVDESFLGNTYVACHTNNNALGAYRCQGRNTRSLFLNCYSEDGQPASRIDTPSMVFGGFMSVEGSAIWLNGYDFIATFPNSVKGCDHVPAGTQNNAVGVLGSAQMPGVALELYGKGTGPYRLHFGYLQPGWWELVYANLNGMVPLRFSTDMAPEGRGHLWLENGYYIGRGQWRVQIQMGIGPPAAGTWSKGDRILNADPVPADSQKGYAGWICVAAGAPGVWRPFGAITS